MTANLPPNIEKARIKAQSEADARQTRLWQLVIEGVTQVTIRLIYGLTIVGTVYFTSEAVGHLAGKTTEATILAAVEVIVNKWFAYGLSAVSTGGFFWKWRAMREHLKECGPYTKDLEQKVDPGRSSSGLGKFGQPQAKKKGKRK